ncbi:MAG: hypothetical protein KDB22_00725 [Planctomycetales bacterium]|jgi:hypothetical protein|nr:hypothetical protein [Planctomycetales bacterium]
MRVHSLALVLCGGFFLTSPGCGGNAPSTAGNSSVAVDGAPPATVDVHAHPSEGPHHGTLVELGNEEYHVEVTHDAASVTVYVLDSTAKKAVPVDSSDLTINILHDGKPEQFKLLASPEQGDPSGKSSRFTLADAELAGHLDEESASPKLSVTIGGTPYRGEIKHDHDHSGHAH